MKIHPAGAELFHVDEQTDRHEEANSHFCNFGMCLKTALLYYTDL